MSEMFSALRSKLIHAKVYLSRALSYASLVNMALILFIALSNLEKYGIDIVLEKWLIPLFILLFMFLVFAGYIEDKLGFFREEQKVHAVRNPQLSLIAARLDKIESKIDSLKK
ncbi:hypothetical protein GF323_00700 [Candidatus Woesearchaeota archaeon]|nr:hypothetical protein [Candidatus Woesearchaeota archaeon]